MKEQLIEFETAKLAKEKGFNESTDNWYRDDRNPNILYGRNAKKGGLVPPIKQGIANCLAPTQSLLQKWLREKHEIITEVRKSVIHEWYFLVFDKNDPIVIEDSFGYTYEQALELGLFEALKLIK